MKIDIFLCYWGVRIPSGVTGPTAAVSVRNGRAT